MALDFQLVQAPFRYGVDEGSDPKQVPFGTLLTAQNVVWEKSGRLQKRQGTTALGTVVDAKRFIVRDTELAITDGAKIYSHSAGGWLDRGRHPVVGLDWTVARDSTDGFRSFDCAVLSNGQIVEAWVTGDPAHYDDDGALQYQIRELSSGAVIQRPSGIASLVDPTMRLLGSGTNWVVLFTKDGDVWAQTPTSLIAIQTDATTNPNDTALDACVVGTDLVVAYTLLAGGIKLARYSLTDPLALVTTGVVTGAANAAAISIAPGTEANALYIAFWQGSTDAIRFAAANLTTLAQTVAPADIETSSAMLRASVAVTRESASSCLLVYSFVSDVIQVGVTRSKSITFGGAVTNGHADYFLRVLSRPIAIGARFYAMLCTDVLAGPFTNDGSVPTSETFWADVTRDSTGDAPFGQAGKLEALTGGLFVHGFVTNPVARSATEILFPSPYQASGNQNETTGWRQGAHLVRATSGADLPLDMWRGVSIGGETELAAGVLTSYDGVEALGYGWPNGPYFDTERVIPSAVAGAMATGNYLYNVTAERRSAAGMLHRSPVGVAITVPVTGPTGKVTLAIAAASLGQSPTNAGIYPFYRSVVGGSVAQRLTIEPSFMTLLDSGLGYPATIVDKALDSQIGPQLNNDLAKRPTLYTEGGELEDTQPPSLLTIALYRNRIFGIAGDRNTLWFSKNFTENPGVAPGFHPQLRFVFNDTLSGLDVLDERLLIFSETGIYVLSGDGPAPNGDGSDYGVPNKLQTDVGCTNPRGIVSGPDGVFFVAGDATTQSEIHLVDRGLNVQWIGKRVQDLLDTYPSVTSAVLVAGKNQVRFSCNRADNTSGIVLVYDYVEKQWSHFVYGGSAAPIVDACMHNGVYTFVTSTGAVFQEDDTTWLDAGVWVTAKLETAWTHATGPLGYHSVRNFRIDGVSASPHKIHVDVGFDGSSSYQQGPAVWLDGVSGTTTPGDSVTANVSIGTRRKCRSVRFRITDLPPTSPGDYGTGQGPKWSSMGIEVGVKKGFGPLAKRQKG